MGQDHRRRLRPRGVPAAALAPRARREQSTMEGGDDRGRAIARAPTASRKASPPKACACPRGRNSRRQTNFLFHPKRVDRANVALRSRTSRPLHQSRPQVQRTEAFAHKVASQGDCAHAIESSSRCRYLKNGGRCVAADLVDSNPARQYQGSIARSLGDDDRSGHDPAPCSSGLEIRPREEPSAPPPIGSAGAPRLLPNPNLQERVMRP